ncbi:unnamed protein product [Moneuplotes crassus]|uniref:Uncharacterized protein n=1 Tax=Euplotes crassus TaxID=5936 RepID=A0AAD2D820_EUPCR|nr:unnamed protein product [Moneuplotes crassus]
MNSLRTSEYMSSMQIGSSKNDSFIKGILQDSTLKSNLSNQKSDSKHLQSTFKNLNNSSLHIKNDALVLDSATCPILFDEIQFEFKPRPSSVCLPLVKKVKKSRKYRKMKPNRSFPILNIQPKSENCQEKVAPKAASPSQRKFKIQKKILKRNKQLARKVSDALEGCEEVLECKKESSSISSGSKKLVQKAGKIRPVKLKLKRKSKFKIINN